VCRGLWFYWVGSRLRHTECAYYNGQAGGGLKSADDKNGTPHRPCIFRLLDKALSVDRANRSGEETPHNALNSIPALDRYHCYVVADPCHAASHDDRHEATP
jgi:hypothetical protein